MYEMKNKWDVDDEFNKDKLTYSLICPKCGQLVEPDTDVYVNYMDFKSKDGNATCKNCGRIDMEDIDFEMN
jgi:transcription elongation factor Elf1